MPAWVVGTSNFINTYPNLLSASDFRVIYWFSIESIVIECIWHISVYLSSDTVILVSYFKGLTIESIVVPYL